MPETSSIASRFFLAGVVILNIVFAALVLA
jgi:hypothetical protein